MECPRGLAGVVVDQTKISSTAGGAHLTYAGYPIEELHMLHLKRWSFYYGTRACQAKMKSQFFGISWSHKWCCRQKQSDCCCMWQKNRSTR